MAFSQVPEKTAAANRQESPKPTTRAKGRTVAKGFMEEGKTVVESPPETAPESTPEPTSDESPVETPDSGE